MTDQQRRLYRSQTNKVIAGVCGGLGEYFNVDTTVVRLVWIILTLLGGAGIIAYILAYLIVPLKPNETGEATTQAQPEFTAARIFGILFVGAGVVILLDNLGILSFHRWWNMSWEFVFPGLLILAGIYFLAKRDKTPAASPMQDAPSAAEPSSKNQDSPSASSLDEKLKTKLFRRSLTDRKLFGICGGMGEYFNIDSTIVRIAYAVFTLLSVGTGILLYLLMCLIIPESQPQTTEKH
jgi:phage shock protein C